MDGGYTVIEDTTGYKKYLAKPGIFCNQLYLLLRNQVCLLIKREDETGNDFGGLVNVSQ